MSTLYRFVRAFNFVDPASLSSAAIIFECADADSNEIDYLAEVELGNDLRQVSCHSLRQAQMEVAKVFPSMRYKFCVVEEEFINSNRETPPSTTQMLR